VNFSPDSNRLVSQFDSNMYSQAYLWRVSDGQQLFLDGLKEVSTFIENIHNQGFSLDSSRYFSIGGAYFGQSQSKFRIVDLTTGLRAQPDTIYEMVEASALNPDGDTLALLCRREGDSRYYLETIRLSDGKTHRLRLFRQERSIARVGPDGKRFLGKLQGIRKPNCL
jgi:WD40 repeat protein